MNVQQQQGDQDSSRAPTHPGAGGSGGTGAAAPAGQQAFMVFNPSRPLAVDLMEQVCDPKNLLRAYQRVRANKGSPGVDGMSVYQLADWLRQHQEALLASLRNGTYRPQPVRGVEIPKLGGGKRQLGIPSVVDRLVQQAMLQVLEPILDPTFSESSFGFRPKRSARHALAQARRYVSQGREVVVDLDLEKFLDSDKGGGLLSCRVFMTLGYAVALCGAGAALSSAQDLARLGLKTVHAYSIKEAIPVKMSVTFIGPGYGRPELRAGTGESLVAVKMRGSVQEPINVAFFVDCFLAEFESQPGGPLKSSRSDAYRHYGAGRTPPDWIAQPTNLPGGSMRKMIRGTLEKHDEIFVEAVFRIPDSVTELSVRLESDAQLTGKVTKPRKTPAPEPTAEEKKAVPPVGVTAKQANVYEGTLTSFLALNPERLGPEGMRVSLWLADYRGLEFTTDVPTAIKCGLFKAEDVRSSQLFAAKDPGWKVRILCERAPDNTTCSVTSLAVLDKKRRQ